MANITKNDFWHALTEPEPIIKIYPDGIKIYKWYNNKGKLHRDNDLPAQIWYKEDVTLIEKHWFQNGKKHRIGGPATIWYDRKGNIEEECWYQYGKKHRINGPAEIWYYEDGSIGGKYWHLNGEEYNENDYIQKLKEMGHA